MANRPPGPFRPRKFKTGNPRQRPNVENQNTNLASDNRQQGQNTKNSQPARNKERRKYNHDIIYRFKKLEELSNKDPMAVIVEITGQESGFAQMLNSELTDDCLVLVMKILALVCSPGTVNGTAIIRTQASKDSFHKSLQRFVLNLTVQDEAERRRSSHFWNDPNSFFSNAAVVFQLLVDSIPSRAYEVLPKTLKSFKVMITNNGIDTEALERFKKLENTLELFKVERTKKSEVSNEKYEVRDDSNVEPPDDFRAVAIYPTAADVLQDRGYLRKNLIDKGYESVDHYLDVQFRLLKEDFVGPLRDGIAEYMGYVGSPKEVIKASDVKIYTKVRFISPTSIRNRLGVLLQFQTVNKKHPIKINSHKRFMFGSLLCFTNDNFQSLLFGKVIERSMDLLEKGQLQGDATKALHLLHTRPLVHLENIDINMNRRPDRNAQYYKSRNWNTFYDRSYNKRRRWHGLDDVWKPNYDYDDCDEWQTTKSTTENYNGQQFVNTGSEKEEDRDSIAEMLQLIHGDEPEKDNKNVDDYEANFRFFNIDKNLSYLHNYGKPSAGSSDVINKRPVTICKKEKRNSDLNIKPQLSVSLTKKDSIIDKTDAEQSKHYKIPKNKILSTKNSSTSTQNTLGQDNASKTTTSCYCYKIDQGNDKYKFKETSQKRKIDLDNGPSKLKLPKVTSEKLKSNIENVIKQSATNMPCLESAKSAEKKLLVLRNTQIEDSLKVENTSNTSAKIKRLRKTVAVTAEPKLQLINDVVDNETGLIAKARRITSQSVEVNKPCCPRLTRSKSNTSKRTCKNETYKELSLSPIQIDYSHDCCKNSCSDANMKQLKRLSKRDHLPTTIPHIRLESNMKDPRLRKPTECGNCNSEADNLIVKPKIMPVTNKVGNKSVSSKKQISEDGLKFLFGKKFKKKSLTLTNPKPTCNLKNWDTRFQVNNDFIPETTADLMILNCLPLMEKASESIHESEMKNHCVNIPQILNDQSSVKQSVNLTAIVQGLENFCSNINYGETASAQVKVANNPNMDVLPNINLPDCNKSNTSAAASSTSTTIERGLNTTQQPQINKTSANNVEVNKSQPKLNKQRRKLIYALEEVPVNSAHRFNLVKYEEFTDKFYYAIFMNCVLDNTIMSKMKHFTSCGFPQEIVRREFEDYMGCFRSNIRRFSQSLCDYFQDRHIVNFEFKTLIYYCLRDNKNTGITLSMLFLIKFFYFVAKEVRRMGQLNGFLLEFCKKIEALYHSSVGMPNVSNTQVAYQQNRQFQPQEQVQQAQHHQQWQPPPTYLSSLEGNGTNKKSKLTGGQMHVYKHQCEIYNTLIKNYRQKFDQPKCLPTARPTMNYTRGQVTSNVFNALPNNTISREVNKPQPQQKLLIPTPESNTTLPNSNVNIVRAPVYKPGIEPTPQCNLQTNVSSNSNVTFVRALAYKPSLDQTPQYNLQTDVSRSQPNTSACNTDLHFPLSEQTNTTGTTMQSTRTLVATNLLQTMLNNSRSMDVIRSQFPNTMFSSTPPSSNLPVCNLLGPSPPKHFQTDEYSIPSSIVNKDLQCSVSERTDTTQFTENFKIQPHDQNFTTKSVCTTTNCAVSTLSSDSARFDLKEVKPNIVQSENRDSKAIDVDEWFRNKLQETDFIDLDDYFFDTDDPVKNKLNQELSQKNANTTIKHPDVLSGERICICSKKAELMCLCGKAIYCSTNCQITDWNNHREQCIRPRKTT